MLPDKVGGHGERDHRYHPDQAEQPPPPDPRLGKLTIQIDILKNASAPFPLRNPGLVSIPLSFVVAIAVALLWPEPEAEARFAEVEQRVHVGIDHP